MRPHRRQPTRLPRPWDSPGKNTGVGCHFLLQCMKVNSESEVAQSCPTLSDPMECSLTGSSIHGIFQARVLEWGAIAFSQAAAYTIIYKYCMINIRNETKDINTDLADIKRIIMELYEQLWRRQWHPTPVLLPRKSHGRRSLVGCSP